MPQPDDMSRSLVPFEQDTTLVAVIELSQSSWLIAGIVPGVERQPLKKVEPDEGDLLRLLHRWRDEATRSEAATRSSASWLRTRQGATASGWRDGWRSTM